MTGYKYAIDVSQLEYHCLLHPDAHIFFIQIQEEKPYFTTDIMTQLSIKAGLKEWGNKSHYAVHS